MGLRDLSIRHKLTLMLLASTLLVLAISSGAFIYAEITGFEERSRARLAPWRLCWAGRPVPPSVSTSPSPPSRTWRP